MPTERPGDLERLAFEKALRNAWTTEFWIPGDPEFRFTDYFEAAVTRNLGLLEGFEQLGADIQQRGILPNKDSDQAQLVTDGGEDLPQYYVVSEPHQDTAEIVAGPKEAEAAESHARFLSDPNACVMFQPMLIHAIENEDYNVRWRENVERPDALVDTGGVEAR